MSPKHPFAWIASQHLGRVFLFSLLLAAGLMAVTQVLNAPLMTPAAPSGIVSFELAGSLTASQAITASWGEEARVYAGLSLGLDYLFMLAYAAAIGLGCVLAARKWGEENGQRAGYLLAWGVWLAAALDAIENYALIRLLLGSARPLWPLLARWCAIPKFALVAAGLLYLLFGAVWLGVGKRRKQGEKPGASHPG